MHNPFDCPICDGQPTGDSMTDDEFSAFLNSCRTELAAKQTTFANSLPNDSEWYYDLEMEQLRFGPQEYRITAIGTHNQDLQTWRWAWANDSFPNSTRSSSSQIKSLFQITGFKVFTDDGINATSNDSQNLSACAIHVLGADGLFRCPGEATLYLAVYTK